MAFMRANDYQERESLKDCPHCGERGQQDGNEFYCEDCQHSWYVESELLSDPMNEAD